MDYVYRLEFLVHSQKVGEDWYLNSIDEMLWNKLEGYMDGLCVGKGASVDAIKIIITKDAIKESRSYEKN